MIRLSHLYTHLYDELLARGKAELLARSARALEVATGALRRRLPAQEMTRDEFLRTFRPGGPSTAAEFLEAHDGKENPWQDVPRERIPDMIVKQADSAVEQHFSFAGGDFFFRDKIDWHHCLTADESWPRGHWSDMSLRAALTRRDIMPARVLNRHAIFVSMALAWRKTGNPRYVAAFSRFLHDWCDQNTPETGIHYASGFELGLRCIAWMQADALFSGCPAYDEDTRLRLHCNLYSQALHIAAYLPFSEKVTRDHRLVGEAAALCLVALRYPEWKASDKWLDQGLAALRAALDDQVCPDGMHFETSFGRHMLVTELALMVFSELRRRKAPVPAKNHTLLEKMAAVLQSARLPGGGLPNINDEDGAAAMPLQTGTAERLDGIFAAMAVLCSRPDFKTAAGAAWNLHAHLLLGEKGAEDFRLLASYGDAPETRLAELSSSRIHIFRHGNDYALMKNNPDPFPRSGGNHADLLHVLLYLDGRPVLVDAGTWRYREDNGFRNAMRGTAAHNTLTVDRRPQAEPLRAFRWGSRLKPGRTGAMTDDHYALSDAQHHCFDYLGVTHRRVMLHLRDADLWAVIDRLEGEDTHSFEQYWHFAPGVHLDEAGENHYRLSDAAGELAHVRFLRDGDHDRRETVLGTAYTKWSHVSAAYGNITPAGTLKHTWTGTLTPEHASHRITLFSRTADDAAFADVAHGVFDLAGWRIDLGAVPAKVERVEKAQ